jgi:hypothetical protein
MNTAGKKKLDSLPRREAAFIEPMECALVPSLPDGPQWVYINVLVATVQTDFLNRWCHFETAHVAAIFDSTTTNTMANRRYSIRAASFRGA